MITYKQYLSTSISELSEKLKSSNKRRCTQVQLAGSVLKVQANLVHEGYTILTSAGVSATFDNLKNYIVDGFYTCKACGKKFVSKQFRNYCSIQCANKSAEHQEHISQTNFRKYGVRNAFQREDVKEKIKKTNRARYNVDYKLQDPTFIKQVQQTKIAKYGSYKPMCMQGVREKIQDTMFKRYGTLSTSQIHITNKQDLSREYFVMHLIKDNMFQYDKALKHFNCSRPLLNKKLHEYGLEQYMQQSRSEQEKELFNWIPCKRKEYNNRTIIGPLELDIVLSDIKLAIEYDGVYWHSTEFLDQKYHLNKTLMCEKEGYQLFHIFETDDLDIWKSMISGKLGLNKRIFARKCEICLVSHTDYVSFCNENHLQGSTGANIRLGLFYENKLVQVMSFGKPRFNKKYQYELIRLCTKKYVSVVGGASKLWKYFLQKYNPKNVISYANRRFSQGKIYKTLGFIEQAPSNPNYWYYKDGIMSSRVRFQKHKLSKLLDTYDPNLSETDNMKKNKYLRIYDCGNLVFTFENVEYKEPLNDW